jgi:hypothetical protein
MKNRFVPKLKNPLGTPILSVELDFLEENRVQLTIKWGLSGGHVPLTRRRHMSLAMTPCDRIRLSLFLLLHYLNADFFWFEKFWVKIRIWFWGDGFCVA